MSNPPEAVLTTFVAVPQAARDARAFTTRILDRWKLSHLTETAMLLVSELITNAVTHAGGVIEPPEDLFELRGKVAQVMLCISLHESLRIEVWDQSSAPPVPHMAASDATSGRGLELVASLSKEWGCTLLITGGKIVWFALDLAA